MSRRALVWSGVVLCLLAWGGMAAYLAVVGLDQADKAASVTAAFLGVAGLLLALVTAARPGSGGSRQRVRGSRVGGSVELWGGGNQVIERSTVHRDVRIVGGTGEEAGPGR